MSTFYEEDEEEEMENGKWKGRVTTCEQYLFLVLIFDTAHCITIHISFYFIFNGVYLQVGRQ
jgi:hypothetical protein